MYDVVMHAVDMREIQQDRWLKSRPICSICGEHIQDESMLHFRFKGFDIQMCDTCISDNKEFID